MLKLHKLFSVPVKLACHDRMLNGMVIIFTNWKCLSTCDNLVWNPLQTKHVLDCIWSPLLFAIENFNVQGQNWRGEVVATKL